jgi:hypothetical protein
MWDYILIGLVVVLVAFVIVWNRAWWRYIDSTKR